MSFVAELRNAVGAATDRALDLTVVSSCAGCYLDGSSLCRDCRVALELRLDAVPEASSRAATDVPPPLARLEWCAPFTGLTRRAVDRLGVAGERRLSGPLGDAMARRWTATGGGGDVLVPVPSPVERNWERGFDETVLLARVAGRRLSLPVVEALGRGDPHLDEAFKVIAPERVRGLSVVLIDDVVGTGERLAACATALMRAGARTVSAVTVARDRLAAPESPALN